MKNCRFFENFGNVARLQHPLHNKMFRGKLNSEIGNMPQKLIYMYQFCGQKNVEALTVIIYYNSLKKLYVILRVVVYFEALSEKILDYSFTIYAVFAPLTKDSIQLYNR